MKNLCAISMLVLGIAGNVFCQKNRSKYDTLTVLEGVRPPIMVNEFARKKDLYFSEEVKKNLNNLVIDFGNKNRLLIDYQGVKEFELRHNVDSLLRNFWQDYSLIRDTLKQNTVRKITYYARNKNVNRKSMIDVQYFPQKEVFQFGKETEIVRLQQDTLVLINFDDKATAELAKSANRVFKTFQSQSFLFNLNAIDDVEEIIDFGVNQAVMEALERAKTERENTHPWKHVNIRNDLMTQKIKSSIKGPALFDFLNLHYDFGIGLDRGRFLYSATAAVDFVSLNYRKRGIALGVQSQYNYENSRFKETSFVFFSGMTFYKNKNNSNLFRGGIFLGYAPFSNANPEKGFNIKLFGWYQLTPLIRIQPELSYIEFNRTGNYISYNPSRRGIKIAFGI